MNLQIRSFIGRHRQQRAQRLPSCGKCMSKKPGIIMAMASRMAQLATRLASALASLWLISTKIARCQRLRFLSYAIFDCQSSFFCKILTCESLKSVGGATFQFLLGLGIYYLILDIQSSYTVCQLISHLATNISMMPCELT